MKVVLDKLGKKIPNINKIEKDTFERMTKVSKKLRTCKPVWNAVSYWTLFRNKKLKQKRLQVD